MRPPYYSVSAIMLILLLQLKAMAISENCIELNGIYTYSLNQQDGAEFYSSKYTFDVSIKGCSWVIKYEQIKTDNKSAEPLDIGSVASCDGTNIYVVHFQNPEADKKVWRDRYISEKSQLPVALANIYFGTYPPPKEPVLQHLWLAFASPMCLLNNMDGKAKPPFITDMAIFSDKNYNCDYHWVTSVSAPNIRSLIFTTDGNFLVRDSSNGKVLHAKSPYPYDRGYTNGIGSWLQKTNIDDVYFPTLFQFTAFVPSFDKSSSNSPNLFKACTYACTVVDAKVSMLPQIPVLLPEGKILVSDRRFSHQGYAFISYPITNRTWLTTSDPFLKRLLQTSRRWSLEDEALSEIGIKPSLKGNAVSSSSKLAIARFVVLCLMLSPLAFFAIKFAVAKNKPKTK
jgi:hypothetical protein